jgi:iron complex transport system substrate-binding protein
LPCAGTPTFSAYGVAVRLLVVALRLALLAAVLVVGGHAPASAGHPLRIISLMPSLTEELFALGAGPLVVGVSAYSDYPVAARAVPIVNDATALDEEKIIALHPDLVVGITYQAAQAQGLERAGIRTVFLPDDRFADIDGDIIALGALCGRVVQARALVERLHAQTAHLQATVKPHRRPVSVFVVLGIAPIYTIGKGSYVDHLIDLAGGRNAAHLTLAYGSFSAEALVAADPDVLVVDRSLHASSAFSSAPWNALRAVRNGQVYELPNSSPLMRPGPRYLDGLQWLIAKLNAVHD